ncbi:MAG: hypothetical protein IKS67_02570, partial [Victivallales bacterium]|nr:hypothetical protein [Victivallales bacterium]
LIRFVSAERQKLEIAFSQSSSPIMTISHYPAEQRHQTAHRVSQCPDAPNFLFICRFFYFAHKKMFPH